MRADDREQVVSLKEITRSLITEEIRTGTDVIMNKAFG